MSIADASLTDPVAEARARRITAPAVARGIRAHADVTQETIAREVGVSTTTVSAWEKGASRPSGELLMRYAATLRRLLEVSV